jgi:hypothetical protein
MLMLVLEVAKCVDACNRSRYELECKYTQFVEVWSRPVWPRLDMSALAGVLNQMEGGLPPSHAWAATPYTDTGGRDVPHVGICGRLRPLHMHDRCGAHVMTRVPQLVP